VSNSLSPPPFNYSELPWAKRTPKLSLVIPCYNEAKTLAACLYQVHALRSSELEIEIIVVDDASSDGSDALTEKLQESISGMQLLRHSENQGKGAALRTGFAHATGDFVAVQDADLEYDPRDLKRLLDPLIEGHADVVLGSRFLSGEERRVLYFWHSLGNRLLTLLSNMLTDLNLSDMETGYKVFRREILQSIPLRENRFGFEPEIVAKIAQRRLRVYEKGISYRGRTYAEGKKIGLRDGLRALYCILKYNLPRAPWPLQFAFYLFIGGSSALINLGGFLSALTLGLTVNAAAPLAFFTAAGVNYALSILLLFRHRARWNSITEGAIFLGSVSVIGLLDWYCTRSWMEAGIADWLAKSMATLLGLALNFTARKFLVFPEPSNSEWKPQR
jgi:glycosyltransferase involved in cell wall biosynthesis